jgi:hypothetical protein
MICQWFDLKTIGTVFSGLDSKSVATVSFGLPLKLVAMVSLGLVSKPVATVSQFGPQNHRDDFLLYASKLSGLRFIGCVTKPMKGGRRGTHVEIRWFASPGIMSRYGFSS